MFGCILLQIGEVDVVIMVGLIFAHPSDVPISFMSSAASYASHKVTITIDVVPCNQFLLWFKTIPLISIHHLPGPLSNESHNLMNLEK